jgi:hypothetical protein
MQRFRDQIPIGKETCHRLHLVIAPEPIPLPYKEKEKEGMWMM